VVPENASRLNGKQLISVPRLALAMHFRGSANESAPFDGLRRMQPAQQRTPHEKRRTKGGQVRVPAVLRWPTHIDDEHINVLQAQPINGFSGKPMLMDVTSDDEYRLARLKRWQLRLLGSDQIHRLRRKSGSCEWSPWGCSHRNIGVRL
jgi:hypothetical protein